MSFNGNVLLAGEVASDELRVQAENIAARRAMCATCTTN